MSQIKIEPWKDDIDQDGNFVTKLNTLSNFSSSINLKSSKIKKKYDGDEVLAKLTKNNKEFFMNSAGSTMNNFHRTNRSEYRHRITKLVFSEQNKKKYKFQPESSPSKKRLGLLTSQKFLKKQSEYQPKRIQDYSLKGSKQTYYNLTEMNSPLNNILKFKCKTEEIEDLKGPEIKILNKIRQEKRIVNPPAFHELFVQRKIYILQSGAKKTTKIDTEMAVSKKKLKKGKNIIEEICKVQRDYSREIKKAG